MGDGILVTGTDTGVGKTVIAAAIAAALLERGIDAKAFKPAMSGIDEPTLPNWPHDHELLSAITGQQPNDVAPIQFGRAYSPHFAATLEEKELDPETLVATARAALDAASFTVVEGIGGFLVPITDTYLVRDFARDLGLRVVVVARPALGTINHSLLTIEAIRAAGLEIAATIVNPWPQSPSELEQSNLETIERLTGAVTFTMPFVSAPTREELVRAVPSGLVDLCLGLSA